MQKFEAVCLNNSALKDSGTAQLHVLMLEVGAVILQELHVPCAVPHLPGQVRPAMRQVRAEVC